MNLFKRSIKFLMLSTILSGTMLLSGCDAVTVVNNEIGSKYEPEDELLVIDYDQNSAQIDEKEMLSGMEKLLENEYLELYIGEYYDIAVYYKSSGKVYWSNPALHDMDESERDSLIDETKKLLFSQVSVEYYNESQRKQTMTSYPDSYSKDKNQVTYEVQEDAVTVRYGLGTNYAETGLVQVFTSETYSYYDSMLKEMIDSKKISIIDYRAFVNNYTELNYSSMKSTDQAEYSARYPKLAELETIYILKPNLTNKITNQLLEMYTMMGITDEVREAEEEKLGIVEGTGLPAYFVIPVTYRLHGNDFIVSVDTSAIEVTEGYYLTKVEIMKSFGATTDGKEGYLFIPDGSGAIIENGTVNVSMDNVSIPFYGQDYGKYYGTFDNIAIESTFPVFGAKSENDGFFAIVENGAAIGGVTAQITSSYMNYNVVYPYLNYTVIDTFDREGVAYAFYGVAPDVEYSIRYHFLKGEDANYSGMARYYRQYLLQKGYLRKDMDTKELPIDIGLMGSIKKTVNYIGIPIEKDYPVTTFDNADSIMEVLHSSGIANTDVLYSGMVNGGMNFKSVMKLKVQKELGGTTGYRSLQDSLNSKGFELYPDIDFTRIYERGNGISRKDEVSRYLNGNTAYYAMFNPATKEKTLNNPGILVNPLLYDELAKSFIKQYTKLESNKLYLSSIGTYLNGNYSTSDGVTRQTSLLLTLELLQTLKDSGYTMKFDCGNDYVLPYADTLTNVPTSSSHQRIESYSIPFVGMVLKGYVPFTCESINQVSNSERAVLEAVESGAGLHYFLMYEDQLTLYDTDQMYLYSTNYELWMDEIIRIYGMLNSDLGYLANIPITGHLHVSEEVNCVIYEDGSRVYVNYGKAAYETSDGIVDAMSYLVIR